MTSLKSLPWSPMETRSWTCQVRGTIAFVLQKASTGLMRLAQTIAAPAAPPPKALPRELEFYAEAGAPEGALYMDGELVGWIPGVTRL